MTHAHFYLENKDTPRNSRGANFLEVFRLMPLNGSKLANSSRRSTKNIPEILGIGSNLIIEKVKSVTLIP